MNERRGHYMTDFRKLQAYRVNRLNYLKCRITLREIFELENSNTSSTVLWKAKNMKRNAQWKGKWGLGKHSGI